jgi:hypothetical protein
MFGKLVKLLRGSRSEPEVPGDDVLSAPDLLTAENAPPFDFTRALRMVDGLPMADWKLVHAWLEGIEDRQTRATAWSDATLGWIAHLQKALGSTYHVVQHEYALVLSTMSRGSAHRTAEFMSRTLARIVKTLDGVAAEPEASRDILIVFETEDEYYRYVARFYPEDGEFAFSGGMHIGSGCSHFVTSQAELHAIEPVIAHEMTHACLGHLPIPAWLNEGLAVNTERQLTRPPGPQFTPVELHEMHVKFWNRETIQEFWSGKSFLRADQGNLLSYELARILTGQFAEDWPAFRAFALRANLDDAGRDAAREHLGVDLGLAAAALFDKEEDWAPNPALWQDAPERGAF